MKGWAVWLCGGVRCVCGGGVIRGWRGVAGLLSAHTLRRAPSVAQEFTVWVANISNYEAHVAGAPVQLQQLGPLVFRRYEQRYNVTRIGFFGEQVAFKSRCVGIRVGRRPVPWDGVRVACVVPATCVSAS